MLAIDIPPRRLGGLVAAAREKGMAERRPRRPPTVVIGGVGVLDRTKVEPDVIFVDIGSNRMSRAGLRVEAPRLLRRLLLVLFAAQGRILHLDDLVDAVYGDDPEGGPESARQCIRVQMTAARDVGAALGFRIETQHGVGYRLLDAKATG